MAIPDARTNNGIIADIVADNIVSENSLPVARTRAREEVFAILNSLSDARNEAYRDRCNNKAQRELIQSLVMLVTDGEGGTVNLYEEVKKMKEKIESLTEEKGEAEK